jgi:hypothetical protein
MNLLGSQSRMKIVGQDGILRTGWLPVQAPKGRHFRKRPFGLPSASEPARCSNRTYGPAVLTTRGGIPAAHGSSTTGSLAGAGLHNREGINGNADTHHRFIVTFWRRRRLLRPYSLGPFGRVGNRIGHNTVHSPHSLDAWRTPLRRRRTEPELYPLASDISPGSFV